MQTSITFEYPSGIDDAIKRLKQMKPTPSVATDDEADESGPAPVTQTADVVRLHKQMDPNQSRRFLEALTSDPLTFQELAARMPKPNGKLYSNASMRAVHRNVRRQEGTLIKRNVISDYVVQSSFDNYDTDGAGRYYLAPHTLAQLDAHLGR